MMCVFQKGPIPLTLHLNTSPGTGPPQWFTIHCCSASWHRRAAAMRFELAALLSDTASVPPLPDGAVDTGERQTIRVSDSASFCRSCAAYIPIPAHVMSKPFFSLYTSAAFFFNATSSLFSTPHNHHTLLIHLSLFCYFSYSSLSLLPTLPIHPSLTQISFPSIT